RVSRGCTVYGTAARAAATTVADNAIAIARTIRDLGMSTCLLPGLLLLRNPGPSRRPCSVLFAAPDGVPLDEGRRAAAANIAGALEMPGRESLDARFLPRSTGLFSSAPAHSLALYLQVRGE